MTDAIARFKRGRAIAFLAAGLAALVWASPLADYAVTSKMRVIAPILDAAILPLVAMTGKTPLLIALGMIGAWGLAYGLGLRLPQISRPALPSRPERDRNVVADEPAATPLVRRRGLAAMANVHGEDAQTAPPRKPQTIALEEKMRTVMGEDFELTDDIADRAMDLAAEWERRGTPHGQHVDPIAIIRKAREKDRDWSGDRSWFGGLPRLGGQAWPRGKDGVPLPFAAQLDLAEIAAANPDTPLPKEGSLAFFINQGAVIFVPPGEHPQTPAPEGLPPAFEDCSYPLPSAPSAVTHPLFPFWPVEAVRLRMPDDLPPMDGDDGYYEAVEAAQQEAMAAIASRSRYSASISEKQAGTLEGAVTTWWYCADLVLRQLQASLQSIPHTIAGREKSIADAQAHRARLLAAKTPDQDAIAQSHRFEERMRASIPLVEAEASGLATFIHHVEGFVAGRDMWSKMSAEEVDVLKEVMETARRDFEQLCRYKVSGYLDDLRNAAIRRMITGDARAAAAIPDAVLAMINETQRLPPDWQHQMFGLGGCRQYAIYDHLCDHLLLQIVYDHLPEFRFGDMGLWQFWISPEALAAGRWDKVELTFECS